MTMIFSFIFFFVFILPIVSQPLSLGAAIMILSCLLSLALALMGQGLFGFILFIVFVGGLLVMFGYVVVLIPNMQFSLSLFFFFFFFSPFLFCYDFFFSNYGDSSLLFSDFSFFLYLGLAFVLLFCLLVVVKVCYFHSGSLRPFFSY